MIIFNMPSLVPVLRSVEDPMIIYLRYLMTLREEVGGGGVLPIMAYAGRLRPKGAPFPRFRYV